MPDKKKPAPKPAPKLLADKPTFGAARVFTKRVPIAEAVRMQAAGFRVDTRHGDGTATMSADANALKKWQGGPRG